MRFLLKILRCLISALGIAVIAVLAVPAGILVLLIFGVWSVTDKLTSALYANDGGEDSE